MKNRAFIHKIVFTLVLLLLCVSAATSYLDRFAGGLILNRMDDKAANVLDETLLRAVETYAAVRALNAVISVLQNTEVSVTPVGLGVTIAAGEILDPLNDLLERFSWVMLISTTSLGIQRILMEIGIWCGFKVFLTLAAVILMIGLWLPRPSGLELKKIGTRLVIAALAVRFAMPAVSLAGEEMYDLFLEKEYNESAHSLDKIKNDVKEDVVNKRFNDKSDPGWFSRLAESYEPSKVKEHLEDLKEKASNAADYIIRLIVVFIFQTVLMPIFTLWLLVKAFGALSRALININTADRVKN